MLDQDLAISDALLRSDSTPDWLLREEAFAIAERGLDERSEDVRRLRRAWRHLRAVKARARSLIDADDLWFAAQLIARVLEVELGLDELEVVALFDAIGLPVDVVPHYEAIAALRTPHGEALGAIASDYAAWRDLPQEPEAELLLDDETDEED